MAYEITIFIILILLSGFFSGIEIAFFSLSDAKVRALVRKRLRNAKLVEKLKSNPQRLLVTILIGNNLVNILAAALATDFAINAFGSFGVGIATGLVTLLVLVFGEIFPKALAQANAESVSRRTAKLILSLEYILYPFIIIFELLSQWLAKLTSSRSKDHIDLEEEVSSMMHIGLEAGSIQKHEKEFVERLFRFNDMTVKQALTPLADIIMLDSDAIIEQVAFFVANSGYSRFPVYKGSRKNIIGMVHIKDIFRANNSKRRDKDISSICTKPKFVAEEKQLDEIFREMQTSNVPHLVVKNKNGEVTGLISIEDVMEELVGEIYDESDKNKTSVIS